MTDSYLLKGKREDLVKTLKKKGVSDSKILDAINNVKRHLFVKESAFYEHAYDDKPFPINAGQTISQPYTVAFQTTLLDVKPYQKILEIGTGSGYQTAILEFLKTRVFSIERQKSLFDETKLFFKDLNSKAKLFYGDGFKGLPSHAPFDRIIITAGAPHIPEALIKQLKPEGKMVIPVSDPDNQKIQIMKLIIKTAENKIIIKNYGQFKFVPMLKNTEKRT